MVIPNPWMLAVIGFVLPSPLNLLADAAEARRADRAAAIGGTSRTPAKATSRAPWARVFWSDGKGMAEGWFVATNRVHYPRRLYLANRGAEATAAELVAAVRALYGDSYSTVNTKVYRLGRV